LFQSLLIISIRLSKVKTKTVVSSRASTVAVLSSSFKRAISHIIFQACNSAIFFHLIDTFTLPDFIIYHSAFDGSFSSSIIFPALYSLSGTDNMISSTIDLSIHENISKFKIFSGIFLYFNKLS
jgi:hypothetical protein